MRRGVDRRRRDRGGVVRALLPRELSLRRLLRVQPVLSFRGGRDRDGRLPQPGDLARHRGRGRRRLRGPVDRGQHPPRRRARAVRGELRGDARALPPERPPPRVHPLSGRRGGRRREPAGPAPLGGRPPTIVPGGAAGLGGRLRRNESGDGCDPPRHAGTRVQRRRDQLRHQLPHPRDVRARLHHRTSHPLVRGAERHAVGRGAARGLRGDQPARRDDAELLDLPDPARHRLELSLHRRNHPAHHHLPPVGEGPCPRAQRLRGLLGDLVHRGRLGRIPRLVRLAGDQRRGHPLPRARRGPRRLASGSASAQPPPPPRDGRRTAAAQGGEQSKQSSR